MERLEGFKKWLVKRGAVLQDPTNPWEVVRFKTINGTSVVYTNKNGHLTFTGESDAAYSAYKNNKTWRAVDNKRRNLKQKKAKLAARDGKKCFYHGEAMSFDDLTIEHLLNKSHGGTDHDSNLCLACEPCNSTVGNWALTKKMLWRDAQLNKTTGEIAKDTAQTIFSQFDERVKHLSTLGVLRTSSLKIELRQIVKAFGVEV
jgi:5-methylcytosine-specific restriction endonuclease McrA